MRNIQAYNQLGAEEIYARLRPEDEEERKRIPTYMPYIVIIADEMADLMMTAAKEVEQHIVRLAQKARAVGHAPDPGDPEADRRRRSPA